MKTLADILNAGHPDTALVGVSVATLRAWAEKAPELARSAVVPMVGTVAAGASA